jgi:hypothetical protein
MLITFILLSTTAGACPFGGSSNAASTRGVLSAIPEGPWAGSIPSSLNASDPLVAANSGFLTDYTTAGDRSLPPLFIAQEGDYVVLFNNSVAIKKEPYTPQLYHDLKAVSHFPFHAFVICVGRLDMAQPTVKTPLAAAALTELRALSAAIAAALPALKDGRFSSTTLHRQLAIANRTQHFIADALHHGTLAYSALVEFAQANTAELQSNLYDAAYAQLVGIDGVVRAWNASLGAARWATMRFILASSHMARTDNVVAQYFARVLNVASGANAPNALFEVTEGIASQAEALRQLANDNIDYPAGDAFFGDTFRLHRDALADGAAKALDELFPR